MSIQKYIAYLRTIELGSISRAASELGYTQSAVSKMIADLESDWDVSLLTRNHSGIKITSEGLELLPTIQQLVKNYEDLNFSVSELHGMQSGTIRIGSFTSFSTSILPQILRSFHELYPGIRFQLFNGEYNEIADWLRRGMVDCGFLAMPASTDFDMTFLLRDTMIAIVPQNHPMASAPVFPLSQLPKENFVRLMEIQDYEFNRLLDQNDIHPEITYDVTSDFVLLSMVEAGLGVSIVHDLILQHPRYQVARLPIDVKQSRDIGVATKRGIPPTTSTRLFIDYTAHYVADNAADAPKYTARRTKG